MTPSGQLFPAPDIKPRHRLLVLGVGGAGCNTLARISSTWSEGPPLVALNTDAQALAVLGLQRALVIGEHTTRGLGAGGDPVAGRLAAEESLGAIQDIIAGADALILVGGLGRGTATGALPIIAKAARDLGILPFAFVSLPFSFEGDRCRRLAEEGLRSLRRAPATVVALPNDRLLSLVDPEAPLEDAFRHSDSMLAEAVYAIWYLLSRPGVINLTIADLQELSERSGGTLAFGYAEAEGPARVAEVLRNLLNSPLLERGRLLAEAQGLLVNVAGGPDLALADVQGIMERLAASAAPGVHITMGALVEATRRNKIVLTVLVAEKWQTDVAVEPPRTAATQRVEAQQELPIEEVRPADKGPFGKASPTMIDGKDLDIPTFIRRGLKLSS